jgi:hypothetical protein
MFKSLSEKGVISRGSGEPVEHEADHGDMDEGHGAGFGGFVVADEATVLHGPSEGALHDPALGQHLDKRYKGTGQ